MLKNLLKVVTGGQSGVKDDSSPSLFSASTRPPQPSPEEDTWTEKVKPILSLNFLFTGPESGVTGLKLLVVVFLPVHQRCDSEYVNTGQRPVAEAETSLQKFPSCTDNLGWGGIHRERMPAIR